MLGAHCPTRSELWARFIHSLAVFWPGIIPWSFSTPVPVSQPRVRGFLVDLPAVSSSSFSPSHGHQPALLEESAADAAGIELQGQPEPSWAQSTNPAPYPAGHLGFASTPSPASPRPHLPVTLTGGEKTSSNSPKGCIGCEFVLCEQLVLPLEGLIQLAAQTPHSSCGNHFLVSQAPHQMMAALLGSVDFPLTQSLQLLATL